MEANNDMYAWIDRIKKQYGTSLVIDEVALKKSLEKGNHIGSNFMINMLSLVGGFLSALAFLGFMAILGIYNSNIAMCIVGLLLYIFAIYLNQSNKTLIWDTLSFSAFTIGLVLTIVGIMNFDINDNVAIMILMILAILTIIFQQSYILTFVSTLLVNVCFLAFLFSNEAQILINPYISILAIWMLYIFMQEAKWLSTSKKMARIYAPIRLATLCAFLVNLSFFSLKIWGIQVISSLYIPIGIFTALVLFTVSKIVGILSIKNKTWLIMVYIVATFLVLFIAVAPSILGSLLALLLCYYIYCRIGLITSLLALLYFIGQYYYDLQWTLLYKSIVMMVSGVVFLGIYFIIKKIKFTYEQS